jgi:NAD+ diphosphatase
VGHALQGRPELTRHTVATPDIGASREGKVVSLTPRLPLSRTRLDRDATSRQIPGFIEGLWARNDTRVVCVWKGEVLTSHNRTLHLDYRKTTDLPAPDVAVYLGKTLEGDPLGADVPIVAAVYSDSTAAEIEPDVTRWVSGRTTGHRLDERDAGVLVSALAVANWHSSHSHSPRSGERLLPDSAGWVLVDESSGSQVFPRTDAAIIVSVTDRDDRLVLGSNALWEAQRYSLLAGFVEPGESLEAAVIREVFEESGLVVKNPRYLGSQPWPFPASLMVGFHAELDHEASGELTPDGTEIVDLRWFSREELSSSIGDIILPGRTSIARAMIEHWYGAELPDGGQG